MLADVNEVISIWYIFVPISLVNTMFCANSNISELLGSLSLPQRRYWQSLKENDSNCGGNICFGFFVVEFVSLLLSFGADYSVVLSNTSNLTSTSE